LAAVNHDPVSLCGVDKYLASVGDIHAWLERRFNGIKSIARMHQIYLHAANIDVSGAVSLSFFQILDGFGLTVIVAAFVFGSDRPGLSY
jgi:hypothetical protein